MYDPIKSLDPHPGHGRPLRELVEVWKRGEPMSPEEQGRFWTAKKSPDFDALAFAPPVPGAPVAHPDLDQSAPPAPAAPAPGLAFDASKLNEADWLAFKARGYQP